MKEELFADLVESIKQATMMQPAPMQEPTPTPPPSEPEPSQEFSAKTSREKPIESSFDYQNEEIISIRQDDYLKKAKEKKNDDYIKKAKSSSDKQKAPLIERPKRPRGRPKL
jgi:hypothetical protein